MAPGPLKIKKTASVAPPPHLPTSRPRRAKTMCRQKLRNEVPEARQLALSCLPNRACKVNSLLRFFAISLNKQRSLSRCFDCEQRSPSARSRLAFSRRGPCVPSRSAPGLSHALHQVRKQGCPSSPALSSHGRKQARDSGHSPLRGPARGRSPRARISNLCSSSTCWMQRQRQSFVVLQPLLHRLQSHSLRDLGTEADVEVGFADPHPVQDTGKLARDRDDRAQHARPFGDPQAPGPQCRPFPDP